VPGVAVVGGAAVVSVTVEVLLAAYGHGTHLLIFLLLAILGSLVMGPRAGFVMLGAGAASSALASLGGLGPADPAAKLALQLALYLGLGTTVLLILASAIDSLRRAPTPLPIATQALIVDALTPREREVLRLTAGGMAVRELADLLVVSPNTVKTHLSHAYAKLDAHNRAQAVRAALHCGCIASTDICPHQVARMPAATDPLGEKDHPIR
jgi:DNA-binding CsgD family transcriptional regulator